MKKKYLTPTVEVLGFVSVQLLAESATASSNPSNAPSRTLLGGLSTQSVASNASESGEINTWEESPVTAAVKEHVEDWLSD